MEKLRNPRQCGFCNRTVKYPCGSKMETQFCDNKNETVQELYAEANTPGMLYRTEASVALYLYHEHGDPVRLMHEAGELVNP